MGAFGSKDFWAGSMFIAFGAGFVVAAQNYSMGTTMRMGPAYFPIVLGGLLALLGAVIGGRSFLVAGARLSNLAPRPIILILLSVVLFALTLGPLGLVSATLLLIVVGSLGGSDFYWKEVAILYFVLIAFSVGAFYYALGMPFQLWPAFF